MKIHMVTETEQRGTYATFLITFLRLKSLGFDVKMHTLFNSEFDVLEPPSKSSIFGEETVMNSEGFSLKTLDRIKLEPRNSIVHIGNAWHGLIPIAEKMGAKTVINIQYWWPICYFNSMSDSKCDCQSYFKIAGCIRRKKGGIKGIASLAEAEYAKRKLKAIRENVSQASAIIAVSKVVKNELIKRGFPEEKIRVVEVNALTLAIKYSQPRHHKFFTYAYLSYPDREKGIFQLLTAFTIALKKNPNIRLKIPGGLDSKEVVKEVHRLGINKQVMLSKRVPYSEYMGSLGEMLSDVDFVVVPSLYLDTWGRVVIESMMAGRPTIVTQGNGGLVEQVEDGVDGFHVNTYDVNAFGEFLYKTSMMNSEDVMKMGVKARNNMLRKFNNDNIMNRLIAIYREIGENGTQ
ncbi:glycosyl transferase [Sulfolobales archaeon HS-7]|nr:glycosyl transferase [Sulfolobales archaeon HS-7]